MDTIRKQHLRFRSASPAALAFALLVGTPAWAQTAPATPSQDAPDPGGISDEPEILVVGTRASLQSALARKKNAGTVVDSIVAEDIAGFPDKNVGEALARITGVQLQRDFGEGTAVSIRGVQPDLNRVQINGVSQQSALGGRGGDFRELQVELVKSVDVYKGYTVDIPEGGIGGTVSIETRRPLELLEPIFAIKAEAQYLDITQSVQPRLNLTAGRADLFGGKLGVIVNVTHSAVDTRSDFVSNTNWNRDADFDRSTEKTVANAAYGGFGTYESCAGTTGPSAPTATANRLACETQFFDWAPRTVRYRNLNRQDYRTSADLQLQYAFADNFSIWGQAQINTRIQTLQDTNYSLDTGTFNRYNLDAPLAANAAGGTSRPRIELGTSTSENHVVTSVLTARNGTNTGTALAPVFNGANNIISVGRRDFDYDQTTQYYQTGFKWELDRLKVTGFGSYSKAKLINNTNLVSISTGVGGILIDRRNELGIPIFNFPESFDPTDPNVYANFSRTGANGVPLVQSGPTLNYRPQEAGTDEKQFQIDLDYDVDFGPLKTIEYGGQYRAQSYINYGGGGARILRPAVVAVPAAGIVAQPAIFQTSGNVTINTVIGPVPATGAVPGTAYLTQAQYRDFIANNTTLTPGAPLFAGLQGAPADVPGRIAEPIFSYGGLSRFFDLSGFNQRFVRESDGLPQIPAYIIDENIVAGYFKVNFEQDFLGMTLTGNAGVRYTWTEDISESSNTRRETRVRPGTGVAGIPAVIETVTVAVQSASFRNDYHDFLPAVNLNLEVLPNLFVRASYAQNLARPIVTDLSPTVNCLFDLADQVPGEDTCSAGNPNLQPYRADQYDLNASWYPNPDTIISVGYFYKNLTSFVLSRQPRANVDLFGDGVLFNVTQPINGFGAKLDGFEVSAQTVFSFLPAPFDGFGAQANFTYSRALNNVLTNVATGEPLDGFPGLSEYTYNGRLFYDKDWLNASVAVNRRTDWLLQAANNDFGGNPIYRRGETYIDARVQFRFTEKYSIFVEGLNLAQEFNQTYIDEARPIEYSYPGRRIFVGAQFKL